MLTNRLRKAAVNCSVANTGMASQPQAHRGQRPFRGIRGHTVEPWSLQPFQKQGFSMARLLALLEATVYETRQPMAPRKQGGDVLVLQKKFRKCGNIRAFQQLP